MASIEELFKNLSYYETTTNYQNPMYQYMNKLYTAEFVYRRKLIGTNFTLIDQINIVDDSEILYYGSMECHASGKQAFVDSTLTCLLFQLPFFLENINFGYICSIFVIPIMLISIFGGIKENYRWYLLNQSIWDLLVCYDFVCEKPTLLGWHSSKLRFTSTCFYYISNPAFYGLYRAIGGLFRDCVRYAPFIPILLLAFSRFLGLYFPIFYKRIFSSNLRNILFIIIFDCIFILLIGFRRLVMTFAEEILYANWRICESLYCLNMTSSACLQSNEQYFQCFHRERHFSKYFHSLVVNVPTILSPLMFSISIIFASLLFGKICFQLKYQLKYNRNSFISTIKIACVIGFQCITMTATFSIILVQLILQQKVFILYDYAIYDWTVYKTISPWIFFLQYQSTIICFNIIRVFLDSIIVLTVLSGYSSCMISVSRFWLLCFTNPKKAIKMFKNHFRKSNNSQTFLIFSKNKVRALK